MNTSLRGFFVRAEDALDLAVIAMREACLANVGRVSGVELLRVALTASWDTRFNVLQGWAKSAPSHNTLLRAWINDPGVVPLPALHRLRHRPLDIDAAMQAMRTWCLLNPNLGLAEVPHTSAAQSGDKNLKLLLWWASSHALAREQLSLWCAQH